MAPIKHESNNQSSNNYGEDVDPRQANILASCYVGPSGIPEVPSTGLPSPPSSPPLAAITSSNKLALKPKAYPHRRHGSSDDDDDRRRRGGAAASRIRKECERFFCGPMRAAFLGEGDAVRRGPGLTDAFSTIYHQGRRVNEAASSYSSSDGSVLEDMVQLGSSPTVTPADFRHVVTDGKTKSSSGFITRTSLNHVVSWLEFWDYAGGASFHGFVSEDMITGDMTLFVFFEVGYLGRDLKRALVALIELAEGPLECVNMVICVDRDRKALAESLRWADFSLTTLDHWMDVQDVTSQRWLFMSKEV